MKLFSRGNLHTGPVYGVEAVRQFDSIDIFGAFSSENVANTFAHKLAEKEPPRDGPYKSITVIRIETPQAGARIVLNDAGAYEYETAP